MRTAKEAKKSKEEAMDSTEQADARIARAEEVASSENICGKKRKDRTRSCLSRAIG